MSDLYYELLVKKEKTAKDSLLRYGTIGLTVLLVAAGLFLSPILLLPALILGLVCYFLVMPGTDLEYEYLFVNGEMDIDMVMAKTKRKKAKNFKLSETDVMAPLASQRMDYYNGDRKMKVYDYSSGNPEHKRFAVITRDGADICKIIIEPDENLANSMKNSAPGKVFLD